MPEVKSDGQYRGWFELRYKVGGGDITSPADINLTHYTGVGGRIPIKETLGNFDIIEMAHMGQIANLPRLPQRWDILRCEIIEPRVVLNFLLVDLAKDKCLLKPSTPGGTVKVNHRPGYPCALWKLPPPPAPVGSTRSS